MQYTVAHIVYRSSRPYQRELVQQALADIGFESFDGDDAYIQTSLLDESVLCRLAAEEHFSYSLDLCPDENWNAVWESEHQVEELPLGVRIIPHCAFGAGHHQTTRMMVDALISHFSEPLPTIHNNQNHSNPSEPSEPLETPETEALATLKPYAPTSLPFGESRRGSVLDMGCGTGVLAIFAARLGAADVLAVDIDDHSTANALENAALNGVSIRVLTQGTVPAGEYDLILANIHRNILLAQMPDYARFLTAGGSLFLSGFYQSDVPALLAEASAHGLHHVATHASDDWRMLILQK